MLQSVLDVLFPRRCPGCREAAAGFCARCRERAVVLSPPGCRRCGRPFEQWLDACGDCPPGGPSWVRSAFLYEGPVRRGLMALKFGGTRSFAQGFAGPMVEAVQAWTEHPSDDAVVTWVPLGRRRKRSRGFDQAEVLARTFARTAGLPVRRRVGRGRRTGAP